MQNIAVPIVVLLMHASALAQTSEGPFMGMPLHLLVGPNTTGPAGTALPVQGQYDKDPGFVDLAAATPPGPATEPRFTTQALFAYNATGGTLPPTFRVSSISSGLNYVFADTTTLQLDMAGSWGALLFSVTRGTAGDPGSLIASRAGSSEGAAADLFSMILPGSTLPTSMTCFPVAVPQLATRSSQMGFQAPTGSPKPEMGDFDPFITMYNDGPTVRALLPDDPWVYFTLPQAVATDPAVTGWYRRGATPLPAAAHGGTILRTQWLFAAIPPHWSPPEVHLTWNELGLTATDEIDALAVDEARNLLVLSLKYDATATMSNSDRQLMIASWTGSPFDTVPAVPATPYKYDAGGGMLRNLSDQTGAGSNGDVDAVCEEDPGNGAVVPLAHAYLHPCHPSSTGTLFPIGMSGSVFLGRPVSGTGTTYGVSVDGLLGVTDTPSLLFMVVGLPSPQGAAFPPGGVVSTYFVVPDPSGWQTIPFSLTHPNQNTPSVTWGVPLDFIWAAFGASMGVVLSPVSRIRV